MSNSIVCGRWDDDGECYVIVGAIDGIRMGDTVCGEMSRYPALRPASSEQTALVLDPDESTLLAWHYSVNGFLEDESGRSDMVQRLFTFVAYEEDGE